MKKVVTVVLCPIILIAFSSVCYFFFIGDPIDGRQIECSIRREENTLWLDITAREESVALDHMELQQDGDDLYIIVRKLPVSPFHSESQISTAIDVTLLTDIYLGGRLIWSKEA